MCKPNEAIGLSQPDLHLFFYEIPPNSLKEHESQEDSDSGDDLNKTAAAEWKDRIDGSEVMVPLNISVVNYKKETRVQDTTDLDKESYFPRLLYFKANSSLIDIHLALFYHIKFIFTRVLELREEYLARCSKEADGKSSLEEMLFYSKLQKNIPMHLTLEKWSSMSLTEQYEFVFSSTTAGSGNSQLKASNPHLSG